MRFTTTPAVGVNGDHIYHNDAGHSTGDQICFTGYNSGQANVGSTSGATRRSGLRGIDGVLTIVDQLAGRRILLGGIADPRRHAEVAMARVHVHLVVGVLLQHRLLAFGQIGGVLRHVGGGDGDRVRRPADLARGNEVDVVRIDFDDLVRKVDAHVEHVIAAVAGEQPLDGAERDERVLRFPPGRMTTNYLIALEDFFFVYPTKLREYQNRYRGSFLHGGVSPEEVILPIAVLTPRTAR